ncbi:MAG: helix-turn-helix transcriptional regulator [Anaerolineaceae bacterium]
MPRSNFSPPSIDYALLGFLISKPMHGYELHQVIQKTPGLYRVWTLKQASLYAKLEKLEKAGLIFSTTEPSPTSSPQRKYLHITEAGKTAFEDWVNQPVLKSRFMRQEFLAKLILVRQLQPNRLPEVLSKQIEVTKEWVSNLERDLEQHQSPDTIEDRWVSSFRLLQGRAILDWLQEVISILSQHPTSPDTFKQISTR